MTAPVLPAGAFAGWDLHPLESAALSRRTPQPVSGDISPKQTVAICIRRVSIQSDLSATRIVAAT
jgi:hypothetical protein